MELKVDLDQDQVNAEIAKAVMESTIGEQIKHAINKHLTSILQGYNNPIENAIKEIVVEITTEEVRKHEAKIREEISTHLTKTMIKDVIGKFKTFLEKGY